MSTTFGSTDEAKEYIAALAGVDPTMFEEVPGLKAAGMEVMLLNDPETSEELKQSIRDRLSAQKGFKFTDSSGQEIKIVIGPFRDGFDCWIIGNNGVGMRI